VKRLIDAALVGGAFLLAVGVFVNVVLLGTALCLGVAEILQRLEALWPN
jgi:hypothetical protein